MRFSESKTRPAAPTARLGGQILAEACIGLSLLTLVMICVAYSTYMANNRIRTIMAARDAAWLQAHGQDPSSLIATQFFYDQDQSLVQASAGEQKSLSPLGGESIPVISAVLGATEWTNKVSFGLSQGVSSSKQYPFILMKTQAPFMPASALGAFSSTSSSCAWPGDLDKTWNSWGDALGGVGVPYVH